MIFIFFSPLRRRCLYLVLVKRVTPKILGVKGRRYKSLNQIKKIEPALHISKGKQKKAPPLSVTGAKKKVLDKPLRSHKKRG
jgi:hypothetical protein